jgi:hypothetical protein
MMVLLFLAIAGASRRTCPTSTVFVLSGITLKPQCRERERKMPKISRKAANRLFHVAIVLAVVIGFVNAWNVQPHVWLTYQVQSSGAAPVRVERCGDDDAREYLYRDGPDGTRFNIDLCFKAVEKNRLKFIPYSTDEDGVSWIELKNSPQIGSYTRSVARSFNFPEADRASALALWQKERLRARVEKMGEFAITLAVMSVLGYAALWIARRFLGASLIKQGSARA